MTGIHARYSRGFTLIELLVSLAIVAMLLVVGLPAFRSYGARISLENAAQAVSQSISLARTLALAPESNKPSSVVAYGLRFPDHATYVVSRYSTGEPDDSVRVHSDVVSATLPNGIQLVDPPDQLVFPLSSQGEPQLSVPATIRLQGSRLRRGSVRVLTLSPVTGQVVIGVEDGER